MVAQVESRVAEVPLAKGTRPGARPRIDALDMTKGVLVMAMVVYHSFNYSTDYTLGFKYLPFLPPSFILITGFLIARLYFTPEAARDSRVYERLFFRGCRLLVLFTLLNLLTELVGRRKAVGSSQGIGYFLDHWFENQQRSEQQQVGDRQKNGKSRIMPAAKAIDLKPMVEEVANPLRRANRFATSNQLS